MLRRDKATEGEDEELLDYLMSGGSSLFPQDPALLRANELLSPLGEPSNEKAAGQNPAMLSSGLMHAER
jgi:hypothetical protein